MSAILCLPRGSNEVYNEIIIHRFNNIFKKADCYVSVEREIEGEMNSLGPSSCNTNLSEDEKWQCGTNVRAPYSEDGLLYEAVIEKVCDSYAVVRFLGYENEEAVELKDLRPSLGEESITEQIEESKECFADDTEYDDDDDESNEAIDDTCQVQWKVGMPCRALYEPNEVVYEAVIQQIETDKRKAVVIMCGYGIPYEASFDCMYESIPELREKQERGAKMTNPVSIRMDASSTADAFKVPFASCDFSNGSGSKLSEKNSFRKKRNDAFHFASKNLPIDQVDSTNAADLEAKFSAAGVSCGVYSCQGMMQPDNENDALACLLSSNYLSGYYAGYFDCIKKFQNSKK